MKNNVDVIFSKINVMFGVALVEVEKQMSEVIRSIPQIVKCLENHEQEKAYATLAEFLETLGTFVEIMSEDIGWAKPIENFPELERAVMRLIVAKENKFWVTICDVLEYEIQPILENWRSIVQTTIVTLPASGGNCS